VASHNLTDIQKEHSNQPKVIVFNAGLWEVGFCLGKGADQRLKKYNISDSDIENCAVYFHQNFKRLLDLVATTFPSDLKVFRTTSAGWMKWGNFGFGWPSNEYQSLVTSPHVVRGFNNIALQLISQSGYDVKVYDLFWNTWSRPDDTRSNEQSILQDHLIHIGQDMLKVSLRKLMTLVSDYLGCFKTLKEVAKKAPTKVVFP
jgi:hypothetical protein